MPLTTAEVNAAVDYTAARLGFVSVHTADPGSTGASEATGSGYARVAVAFGASSNTDATAAEVTVTVPAGSFTHFGFWSAATGGTFRGGGQLTNASGVVETATFASAGQLKVTAVLDGSTS